LAEVNSKFALMKMACYGMNLNNCNTLYSGMHTGILPLSGHYQKK